jgi:hypothetical protein
LAHQYPEDLDGFELYQGYKEVIISLKRAERLGKTGLFSKATTQIRFISGIGGI